MRRALMRHDQFIETGVAERRGVVVRTRGEGGSRFAVFPRASDAMAAALAIQRGLLAEPWPTATPLRVRMALHTGEADLRDGNYYGAAVNRCARLRALGEQRDVGPLAWSSLLWLAHQRQQRPRLVGEIERQGSGQSTR